MKCDVRHGEYVRVSVGAAASAVQVMDGPADRRRIIRNSGHRSAPNGAHEASKAKPCRVVRHQLVLSQLKRLKDIRSTSK